MKKIKELPFKNSEMNPGMFENVQYFMFAEGGAMGRGGEVLLLTSGGTLFANNYAYGDLILKDLEKVFPPFRILKGFHPHGRKKIFDGWRYIDLGAGNHLFMKNDVFKAFKEKVDLTMSPGQIFASWIPAAMGIIAERNKGKRIEEVTSKEELDFMISHDDERVVTRERRREKLIEIFEDAQTRMKTDKKLQKLVEKSRNATKLYEADDYPEIRRKPDRDCWVSVVDERTVEAAESFAYEEDYKIAILNFASATRPGGGVKNGAGAQEECICRCTTLFPTIDRKWLWQKYYDVNRAAKDVLHTDACIYSPDVYSIASDETFPFPYDEPFCKMDVISCAAPNLSDIPYNRHNPETGQGTSISDKELYDLHLKRAKHILHIAAANDVNVLILGAFGCGAFHNDPEVVSKAMNDAVKEYKGYFDEIVFAIPNDGGRTSSNYLVFEKNIDYDIDDPSAKYRWEEGSVIIGDLPEKTDD